MAMQPMLLHGMLDIWVHEATGLVNHKMFYRNSRDMFGKKLDESIRREIEGRISVRVSVANVTIARTSMVCNCLNPVWGEHFNVPVCHYDEFVCFYCERTNIPDTEAIEWITVPVKDIIARVKIEDRYFKIQNLSGISSRIPPELKISIQYTPVAEDPSYSCGIVSAPSYPGIPGTYFPLRQGGNVTLYQDAHVPDEGSLFPLVLDNGDHYKQGKCWYDIYDAIVQARHLIYISGWSLYHKVKLLREGVSDTTKGLTLGDLLKDKARKGVTVLLLLWDDPTSVTKWSIRKWSDTHTVGLMQTHDEETQIFFKKSHVRVLLSPHSARKELRKHQESGIMYAHHQNFVIVDTDAGNGKRKIISFIGGLDLCDGRYDTPQHQLQTLHKEDYPKSSFMAWHDLHCKIDGPAAYDILTNFEERWRKASKGDAAALPKLKPDILKMFEAPGLNEYNPEAWHVQVFRSIDSKSVEGFPESPTEITKKNLVNVKNVVTDVSIYTAYINSIRAAQNFIYIENQYFLGSSYNWKNDEGKIFKKDYRSFSSSCKTWEGDTSLAELRDLAENSIIPMEIAHKICNKIRARERFSAYIVVPMWPEGDPKSDGTQTKLFWQYKTMQMMYEAVYEALKESGPEEKSVPQDYLNFFCLGNRVKPDANDSFLDKKMATREPAQDFARKSGRFEINVHSKGMIVDDEYIILGSANINRRSMVGTEDTEIAMGAYQPEYTWAKTQSSPHGQVYGYRMSLWAEHMALVKNEEYFDKPESLQCVERVRSLAESNWKQFIADEATDMEGHLMTYPLEIDQTGMVKSLLGSESFWDVGGNVTGTFIPSFNPSVLLESPSTSNSPTK